MNARSKSGSSVVVGYRYYMSLMMGLCRGPIDEITEIKIGDKTAFPYAEGGMYSGTYASPIYTSGTYSIEADTIFGGDKKEGGVAGSFTVMMGDSSQVYPDWIKSKLGGSVPDYRGVVTAFFDGLLTSLNPYPKKWKIRHRRTMNGWDGAVWQPSLCTIWLEGGTIKAMNPAHILYECATNREWGRGFPRSRIDEASWLKAAQILYNEGFGLCLRWNRRETLQDFVQTVLNHVGGAIYIDRESGLINFDLIRSDYNPNTLPLFGYNSGLLSIDRGETAARDNAVNEIVVVYRDPISDGDREVRAQNLASIQSLGSVNNSTINYPGLPTFSLAARVAQRDLRASTSALRRYKVTLDRRAWRIYPGALFRISAPDQGISNLILRAGKVTESNLTDGKIVVEALVDVFGLPFAAFIEPQEPGWVPPNTSPVAVSQRKVRELTYRDLYLRLSSTELAAIADTAGGIATMAVKPSSLALNYAIATKVGSESYVSRTTDIYSPAVSLNGAIDPYTTSIPFDGGAELGLIEIGDLVQIDNEIVLLTNIAVNSDLSSGTLTIARGCLDTVPAPHADNALAFFLSDPIGTDGREYAYGETVDVKMLTATSTGNLDPSLAPVDSLTILARQFCPYPPGNVLVNGSPCFGVTEVAGVMSITWTHRDRVTQADQIIYHGAGSIGPEEGVTYNVRVYSASNTLLATASGLTGTSYSVPIELVGNLRFELESAREGRTSLQKYVFNLTRS